MMITVTLYERQKSNTDVKNRLLESVGKSRVG